MLRKSFKKFICFTLSAIMVMGLSTTAFAAEPESTTPKYLPADVDEITEEIIEEYGIVSFDENGNKIITIPLGPANYGTDIAAPDYTPDDDVFGLVHDGHTIPDDIIMPLHFSLTPHSHEVTNLSSYTLNTYEPATEWADQGFTITKEYNRSVEINASLNLNGGISKSAVEAAIGVTVGGSYTRGSSESYSKTVPDGYKGRIVYYYSCTVYTFTNKTAYVWPNTIPQLITYEYDNCSASGAPYNGYFGLQLVAR